jgi:hypothetical protein
MDLSFISQKLTSTILTQLYGKKYEEELYLQALKIL